MKRIAVAALILVPAVYLLVRSFGGEGDGEVRLTGVVSANEAVVASELSGRIRELRVEEGDWVEKGQVVAVLATEELDAQRQSRIAAIDQLSRRVEQDREKAQLERSRVTSQIEGATAQLRAVESQSEEYRVQLEQARRELEHTDALIAQGLVASNRRDRNETMVSVVEARLQAAEDAIAAARAELDLHRASERQVRVMAQQVEQTEAQIEQARAELEQISVRLGYTELKSPLAGMVSVRVAREGEFVAAGEPVVTIVDLSDVWVRTQVEETLVTRLVVGQPLEVRLVSDEELTGQVIFISPEAEFATQRDVDRVKRDIRTFAIKVAVPNANRRVHPGMTAYVILPPSGEPPDVPTLLPLPERPPRAPAATDNASAVPEPLEIAAQASPDSAPRSLPPSSLPSAPEPMASRTQDKVAVALPAGPSAVTTATPSPGREDPQRPEPTTRREESPPARAADPAAPRAPEPLPEDELEALLASIDLENASEEDIARLEASLLGQAPVPFEPDPGSPEPALSTPSPSPDPNLPAWAEPRPEPLTPTKPAETPAATVTVRSPERATSESPELQLEGISRIDGKPVAIINGVRVFEGEAVAGARVLSIADGTVLLDRDGRRITLAF